MNELYIIIFKVRRTMVGRLAFKTREAAEEYIKRRAGHEDRYVIERYLPAPMEGFKDE